LPLDTRIAEADVGRVGEEYAELKATMVEPEISGRLTPVTVNFFEPQVATDFPRMPVLLDAVTVRIPKILDLAWGE
jgi:hypothetical protein